MKQPSRRNRRPLRRNESGVASSMVAFLIAGVLFIGSIAAVLLTTRQGATGAAASTVPQADLHVQAQSLSQLLVMSPGYTTGHGDWAAQGVNAAGHTVLADQVARLGLKEAGSSDPLLMSYGKFQNLRRAPYAATVDGYVNYPEAREGFGLDEAGLDFHIRAYPTLPTVAELLKGGRKDPNLHVTYLGDIDATKLGGQPPPSNPTEGLAVTVPTCAVSPLTAAPNPQAYRLAVTVTNGGTTTTQFSALFTYILNATSSESQNANGPLVAPGQSVTLYVDVPAYEAVTGNGNNAVERDRDCAPGSVITVDVQDTNTAHVQVETTLADGVHGARQGPRDLWLDTSKPYYVNANGATTGCANPVSLNYDGLDLESGEFLRLKIHDGTGVERFNASIEVPNGNQRSIPGTGVTWNGGQTWTGCFGIGTYTATLYHCGSSACTGATNRMRVTESIVFVTSAPAGYLPQGSAAPSGNYEFTSNDWSRKEVAFVEKLVTNFCPTYYNSASLTPLNNSVAWGNWTTRCSGFKAGDAQLGDVFPDSKDIMNNDLAARLMMDPNDCDRNPRYDITNVIIAGSHLDQTAMTSAAAKRCLATWVFGGGYLIVFGSDEQNVNWLEPIFHAAIRSSSGGLATPDAGHPVLNTADVLDHTEYDNHDRVWNFNGQTAQNAASLFTNVVVQGGDPVITISNAGAMGNGSVSLLAWMPYELNASMDANTQFQEGLKLTNNLLMQGYRDLFLDYGPALPSRANVEPAVSRVHINHPQFEEPILLDVSVYVFPGSGG